MIPGELLFTNGSGVDQHASGGPMYWEYKTAGGNQVNRKGKRTKKRGGGGVWVGGWMLVSFPLCILWYIMVWYGMVWYVGGGVVTPVHLLWSPMDSSGI